MLSGPDGGAAFFDGGDNMCIPRGARNASGAWEFVRFALDLPQQIDLPAGGYTPGPVGRARRRSSRRSTRSRRCRWSASTEGYAPTTLSYNLLYNQPDGPWLQMFRRAVFDGELEAAMTGSPAELRPDPAQGQA